MSNKNNAFPLGPIVAMGVLALVFNTVGYLQENTPQGDPVMLRAKAMKIDTDLKALNATNEKFGTWKDRADQVTITLAECAVQQEELGAARKASESLKINVTDLKNARAIDDRTQLALETQRSVAMDNIEHHAETVGGVCSILNAAAQIKKESAPEPEFIWQPPPERSLDQILQMAR